MLQDRSSSGDVPCIESCHHLVHQVSQCWACHHFPVHLLGLGQLPDQLLQCCALLHILGVKLVVTQLTELGPFHVGLMEAKSCAVLGYELQRLSDLVDLQMTAISSAANSITQMGSS